MFALPFSAHLHESLSTHVFGRFMPPKQSGAGERSGTPAADPSGLEPEDAMPDLAQRVREVGEW